MAKNLLLGSSALLLLLGLASHDRRTHPTETSPQVSVRFYGEAECPFCRKFVTQVWPPIWHSEELRPYLDYDFVPWGNAYFSTKECGDGPYDAQQRACWYEHCIIASSDDDEVCFGADVVYQHGKFEGQIDVYASCIKEDIGLEEAVDFTFCCEGPNMETVGDDAKQLLELCMPDDKAEQVHQCFLQRERDIEIHNAKRTPIHPGVPYVVVDGVPLDDPIFGTLSAICESLKSQGIELDCCSGSSQS